METITLELIPLLQKEMEQEAVTTRKMLSRVPSDKLDWQPHPKSMALGKLAGILPNFLAGRQWPLKRPDLISIVTLMCQNL